MSNMLKTIIVFFTLSFTAKAQKASFQPLYTAINVTNIDSSIRWYTKVLNLTLRNRVDSETRGFKQAVLVDKGIMIELVELKKVVSVDSLLKTQPPGTRTLGFSKFGFIVPQIDALFERFSTMSLAFHGKMVVDPVNNKKTFIVADPDGNLIQFFQD